MRNAFLLVCVVSLLLSDCAYAGSATWNLNPTSGDWSAAANWTPATVPNAKSDTATFGVSNTTNISPSDKIIVDGINFAATASPFTITIIPQRTFTISGAGITSDSSVVQNLVMSSSADGVGTLNFTNSARVVGMVSFTNYASHGGHDGHGGYISFQDTASAGSATFRNLTSELAGRVDFVGNSTADHATFVNDGIDNQGLGGTVNFFDNSSAGYGTFLNSGGLYGVVSGHGGIVQFYAGSTADHGTFTCEGGQVAGGGGGEVIFYDGSTAGEATIIAEGGTFANASGGQIELGGDCGNATFIANGGQANGARGAFVWGTGTTGGGTFIVNGGTTSGALGATLVLFSGRSSMALTVNGGSNGGAGGQIQCYSDIEGKLQLFGNGWLYFPPQGAGSIRIGAIEGSGKITLDRHNVSAGSYNLSTVFSGLIEDGDPRGTGSLTKVGTGNLTLTGKNTYSGGTVVESGILLANNTRGSGTGKGPVQVNGGTFGGSGTVSGNVIVGTGSGVGAILGPGARGVTPGTLTIKGI